MSMKNESKLLSKGGQGCTFIPEIPCKKSDKRRKNSITKISFDPKSAEREYELNQYVSKIPDYDDWCVLWTHLCKSPNYEDLKDLSEIEKCIYLENVKRKKRSKSKLSKNTSFHMLSGPTGGRSCVDYFEELFSKDVLTSKTKFTKTFVTLMKACQPLFLGIQQLSANKISHHDINNRNVLYKNRKIKLIDFGLALKYSEKKKLEKRLKNVFHNDKIYESYPWDYTLLYASTSDKSKQILRDELQDIMKHIYRDGFEDLEIVYNLLGVTDYRDQVEMLMDDILKGKFTVDPVACLGKLDVYSVGIMIPTVITRQMREHNISLQDILKVIDSEEVKPYFDLFRDMTYLRCTSRISANLAYDRYKNL